MRIAVLGVGLIGGSIGLAARESCRGAEVVGFGRSPANGSSWRASSARSTRAAARSRRRSTAPQVCFACAPVGALPGPGARGAGGGAGRTAWSPTWAPPSASCWPRSTTRASWAAIRSPGPRRAGVEHARADLFQGAVWYLTPHERSSGLLYERLHRFVMDIGARPVAVDPETHDRLVAVFSHLPHVLANVLVAQAAGRLLEQGEALRQVGPSFRDATRVAGANTAMWSRHLPRQPRGHRRGGPRLRALARTRWRSCSSRRRRGRGLERRARAPTAARLLEAAQSGGPVHELRLTVPNRPGIVAQVALALGQGGGEHRGHGARAGRRTCARAR